MAAIAQGQKLISLCVWETLGLDISKFVPSAYIRMHIPIRFYMLF